MTIFERHHKIIEYLNVKQIATVTELSKAIITSESTIRRDIKILEEKGFLSQTYGGVVLAKYMGDVVPISLRDTENSTVKERLAKEAAKNIQNGNTVFLDGSSTVRRIVKYIGDVRGVKIITNNHKVFTETISNGIELYSTGGHFVKSSKIYTGPQAEKYISNINADIVFFSSQAISENGEISDVSESETSLRRAMINQSEKKIFLCDSSKFGLKKTFTLCTKDDVDLIISDISFPWDK